MRFSKRVYLKYPAFLYIIETCISGYYAQLLFLMKKIFLLAVAVLGATLGTMAQKGEKAIGLNLSYGSEVESAGIGVKFNYGLTDQIRLSPSFNYFLENDGLSAWEVNADAHYLFNVAPGITVYPLAGLTFTHWKFDLADALGIEGIGSVLGDTSSSDSKLGINIGGGIDYKLTDQLSLGLELKYGIVNDFDQFVPSVHLMYAF